MSNADNNLCNYKPFCDNSCEHKSKCNNPVCLSELDTTNEGVVVCVQDNNKALHKKLLSMGIVQGTKIKLLTKAPLGGPVRITALGYQLSLRVNEAESIIVNQL